MQARIHVLLLISLSASVAGCSDSSNGPGSGVADAGRDATSAQRDAGHAGQSSAGGGSAAGGAGAGGAAAGGAAAGGANAGQGGSAGEHAIAEAGPGGGHAGEGGSAARGIPDAATDGSHVEDAGAQDSDSGADAAIPEPAITRFSLETAANAQLRSSVEGQIVGALIKVSVPYWVDVTALVPTFVTAGTSVVKVASVTQQSGVTSNDFTNDVTYAVTAVGGDTASYVVSVTRALFDPSQVQVIQASDRQADDNFGFVKLHGDTAVVSANNADSPDGSVMNAGAAYVFQRGASGTWAEEQIFASNLTSTDEYGFSIAAGDDVAVVGANYETNGRGAAYIYEKSSGPSWAKQKLLPVDAIDYENFGNAVAIGGGYLFVSAPYAGPADYSNNPGTVYVYKKDGTGNWASYQTLTSSDGVGNGTIYDEFGNVLAVSGDHLIVGADEKTVDANDGAGSAYIFDLNHTTGMWEEKAKLHASDAQANDRFGFRVAIGGDYAVVEAPNEDGGDGDPDSDSGSLYIFERGSSGAWTQTQILRRKDLANNAIRPDAFAVDQGVLVVGDNNYSPGALADGGEPLYSSGRAFIFQRSSAGIWQKGAQLVPTTPGAGFNFGISISIDRGTLMVGAIGNGDPAGAGAVYVFQ
ncbi:MAG TPA: hypothetical protein VHC69_34905 [Polyangiaceae bacterium]|nr:hypothetical protein [Polyangiaceae bacterium]